MGMLRGARTASGAVAHSFQGNPTWHVLHDDEFHSCQNVATISQTINASGPPQIVTAPHSEEELWSDSCGSQAATRQTHARDASPSEQGKATAGQPSQRWSQKPDGWLPGGRA